MITHISKQQRHNRIRRRIIGSAERPRLTVFRSLNHIYAQIIDDTKGRTLVSASDYEVTKKEGKPVELSHEVGQILAKKAKDKKITSVSFDRGGNKYHGRVKALAEGARDGGLQF